MLTSNRDRAGVVGHAQLDQTTAVDVYTPVRQRLLRSLQGLPLAGERECRVLCAWLDHALLTTCRAESPTRLSVALDARQERVTWTATAGADPIQRACSDLFMTLGVADHESELLFSVLLGLEPSRMAMWMQLDSGGFDGGWEVVGPVPLSRAMLWVAPTSAALRLAAWAEDARIATCSRLRRSVGEGTPYMDLVLPLPGPGTCDPADLIEAAIGRLSVNPLAHALTAIAIGADDCEIALTARLFEGGLAGLGIAVTDPSPRVVSYVKRRVGGIDDVSLRGFEQALTAHGPSEIRYGVVATGLQAELGYSPHASA